jgi:phospholipase/carboxylesterase
MCACAHLHMCICVHVREYICADAYIMYMRAYECVIQPYKKHAHTCTRACHHTDTNTPKSCCHYISCKPITHNTHKCTHNTNHSLTRRTQTLSEDTVEAGGGASSESEDKPSSAAATMTAQQPADDQVLAGQEAAEPSPSAYDDSLQLECCVVDANDTHTATVIWLHGQGDLAEHFSELPSALTAPWCKFIFPNAPLPGFAWFDSGDSSDSAPTGGGSPLRGPAKQASFSESVSRGLSASARAICKLIQEENKRGIPSRRILLAGFGQGGVVATYAALSYGERLGGACGVLREFESNIVTGMRARSIVPWLMYVRGDMNRGWSVCLCARGLNLGILDALVRLVIDCVRGWQCLCIHACVCAHKRTCTAYLFLHMYAMTPPQHVHKSHTKCTPPQQDCC